MMYSQNCPDMIYSNVVSGLLFALKTAVYADLARVRSGAAVTEKIN